ncbi:OmpA family protein [Leptospira ognonensis]|uniref:OmpA family protein n=1 Tax=Leptospira ognonensis TaxID=2484945 RepID=A0A4R9K0M3_9LEPT|nr:OmpA family protein [Leptospira ognonensis]
MELSFILISLFTAFIILIVFFSKSSANPRTKSLNTQTDLIILSREHLKEQNEFLELPFSQINFDAGESNLSKSNLIQLQELIECLIFIPDNSYVRIQGLADATGSKNRELAKARATNVYTFLISKGIPKDRLRLKKPIVLNATTGIERKKYRSVTFELVSEPV